MNPIQYKRKCRISLPQGQSAFLWGPRQTGKTTLLKENFPHSVRYDLLDSDIMLRLLSRPRVLGEELKALGNIAHMNPVIIDEIQKVPVLLDEVHRLIESERISFVLCGSSARKLKRNGMNLLGGRAWKYTLHPLTWYEVPEFNLLTAMSTGLLPGLYAQEHARRSLRAYVQDYLTQEVFNEALIRKTAAFSRFFDALSYCHGGLLNFLSIARDCGIDAKTVRAYFEILVDTMVGYLIYPYTKKSNRQIISNAPKFYLFDIGIANYLTESLILSQSGTNFGKSFEHFIFLELVAANSYSEWDSKIEFWRTKNGLEVDFVLGDGLVAIKVKSRIRSGDLTAIKVFREQYSPRRSIVVTAEPNNRNVDGIEVMSYEYFLDQVHNNRLLMQ